MEIILQKFDSELESYTRHRLRDMRGETSAQWTEDPFIERYTRRRIRELRIQYEMEQREIDLDNVALGGYTVAAMEAYSGKS